MTYGEEDIRKVLELTSLCKEQHAFEFNGILVKGYMVDVVKEYVSSNPDDKFRTWLIKTQKILT